MYLSASEIAHSRDQALQNLLAASTAYVDAGERLTALLARAGHDIIERAGHQVARWTDGSAHKKPGDFWLGALPADPARFWDETLGIFGDTYATMVEAAQAQVGACDRLLVAAIDRSTRAAPWEGEIALAMLRNTVAGVESSLNHLADAITRTSEAATPARRVK